MRKNLNGERQGRIAGRKPALNTEYEAAISAYIEYMQQSKIPLSRQSVHWSNPTDKEKS